MFKGIHALPPGFTLSCDANGVTVRPYWDLSFASEQVGAGSEAAYAEQLEALLKDSVKEHLMSDVPFGAFLSGGVDSSTIVALMSEFLADPVKTFSVGLEGDGAAAYSELPYARLVAERYQTDHDEVLVRPRDLIELADKIVWHLDQPIADEAALGNYMLAELASRQVKMVLTGEGGDELFAGYARYAGEQFSSVVRRVPAPARTLALAASARIPGLRRPKIAFFALSQTDEITRLVNWFPPGPWRQDEHGASVEARVPLLDHRLVEFAARLATSLKVRRNGPDLNLLRLVEPNPALQRTGKTIIAFAGVMGMQDGVDYLLKALWHLTDLCRTDFIGLLIGGLGDVRPSLQVLSSRLGLDEHVRFTGWVSDAAYVGYYDAPVSASRLIHRMRSPIDRPC
jgi:asparagine synthase (glutamine-hydrolysing)